MHLKCLGVTKQNRLWEIALPQRKLLKWPSPPCRWFPNSSSAPPPPPPLPTLKAEGKTGSLQAHSDAQCGDKQTKCRLSVAKWFATAKTVPTLGVCGRNGGEGGVGPQRRTAACWQIDEVGGLMEEVRWEASSICRGRSGALERR